MYRLAILNSHPIQYFAPLYSRLAKEAGLRITVYYCSRHGIDEGLDPDFGKCFAWDRPLLDGYDYKFLPAWWGRDYPSGFLGLFNPAIINELRRKKYDAVWIHDYRHLTNVLALLAARLAGSKVFYRTESSLTYDKQVNRPIYLRLAKTVFLRLWFSQVSRFLAIGSLNRHFYIHYGVKPEAIHHVPYCIDNDYFAQKVNELRPTREMFRRTWGIRNEDVVFIFPAKMTPQKRPLQLLEAYSLLDTIDNKALFMVGAGTLLSEAKAYVSEHRLQNVHFTGFVNQSDIPQYYAASDVLVRPDGVYKGDWGLTINEAMASGLAIVATDAIGATADLVKNGVNGYTVAFDSIAAMGSAMRQLALNPALCRRMGDLSKQFISNWNYEACVRGLISALHSIGRQ